MNTSTQHPLHSSKTLKEGNLSVSQTPFTPSPEALELKGIIDKMSKRVGDFIEDMERRKEEFLVEENKRKIEEICLACEKSYNEDIVRFGELIRKTGNVNEKYKYESSILEWIISDRDHTEIIKLLLAHPDILVNEKYPSGETTLWSAVKSNCIENLKLLLAHPDILVNEKNSRGDTILKTEAYDGGLIENIKLLLAHPDILVNEKDTYGNTALMDAVSSYRTEIAKLLLAHPDILVNEKNSRGVTALRMANSSQSIVNTQLLLADPRLDLRAHDQGINALKEAQIPEIKSLIEEAMRKQGIEF